MLCPGCGRNINNQSGICPLCGAYFDPVKAAASGAVTKAHNEQTVSERQIASGFWRRLIAYYLDVSIVGLIQVFIMFAVAIPGGMNPGKEPNPAMILLSFGVWILYFSFFESSQNRATPGKAFMQAYVTDLNGQKISFGKALVRTLGKILSSLIFCIGFLIAAFTQNKQALHDMIAGTLVQRREQVSQGRFIVGVILSFLLPAIFAVIFAIGAVLLGIGKEVVKSTVSGGITRSTPKAEVELSDPEIPELPVLPDSEPAAQPEQPSVPIAVSPNFAEVGAARVQFKSEIAFSRRNGSSIQIGLFRDKLSDELIRKFEFSRTFFNPELPAPDLVLELNLKMGAKECSADALSSYVVIFNSHGGGFKLPGGRPSIEFARAVTNDRSREGIAIACTPKPESSIVVSMKGKGGAAGVDQPVPYQWNLAFKTVLVEVQ